jgi:hypothetical protein
VPHPCCICTGGDFGPSIHRFPIETESKPPPFEDHKGRGTRKAFSAIKVFQLGKMAHPADFLGISNWPTSTRFLQLAFEVTDDYTEKA